MQQTIKVNYEYTNNLYKAKMWLEDLPDLFAADFEVSGKYTRQEKEIIQYKLDNYSLDDETRRVLLQRLTATGLSHPSLTVITHLSVGWSKEDAYVIICDTPTIRKYVFNFLTSTKKQQLWHNCIFDFKHIYYHTSMLPVNYIDTQLLAKSLINDADSFKARTGLKELMGTDYGAWAISKENFVLEEQWNEDVIKYSATDSTATFKLYQDIQSDLQRWKI